MAKTTKFTVDARSLTAALTLSKRFAFRDGMLPSLASVLFTEIDGTLHLFSTDRYRAAIVPVLVNGDEGVKVRKGVRVIVPMRHVDQILTIFKATRRENPDLTVSIADQKVTVSSEAAGAASLSFAPLDSDYPDLIGSGLFRRTDDEGMPLLNGRYLADAAVSGSGLGLKDVRLSRAGKAVLVESDRALVLVMGLLTPVEEFESSDRWSRFTDAPAPVEKQEAAS
jgi:hypothetical protein